MLEINIGRRLSPPSVYVHRCTKKMRVTIVCRGDIGAAMCLCKGQNVKWRGVSASSYNIIRYRLVIKNMSDPFIRFGADILSFTFLIPLVYIPIAQKMVQLKKYYTYLLVYMYTFSIFKI